MPMEDARREPPLAGAKLGFRHRKLLAAAGVVDKEQAVPQNAGTMGPPPPQPPPSKRKNDIAVREEAKTKSPRKQQNQQQNVRIEQTSGKRSSFTLLVDFFDALEQTVALLKIRSRPCTFTAVAEGVESITKRRFLHSHLAKLKHLFPEVIECDTFSWKDLENNCTKSDIRIKLLVFTPPDGTTGGTTGGKSVSGISRQFSSATILRRQEFNKRIERFEENHPEADDIPEAPLLEEGDMPELNSAPVDLKEFHVTGKATIKTGYEDAVSRRVVTGTEVNTSHFSPSFKPFFSKRRSSGSEEDASAIPAAAAAQEEGPSIEGPSVPEPAKQDPCLSTPVSSALTSLTPKTASPAVAAGSPKTGSPATLRRLFRTDTHYRPDPGSVEALAKSETARPTPKRASVVKSLRFGKGESEAEPETEPEPALEEPILSSVPPELLQSVREKEQKAIEDKRSDLAGTRRRQQMIAGLPQFFNMTRSIYQSEGRSVMLHKELVKQITLSSTEITDQDEIQERIKLLLELAPDWISSKASLTGDVMYRVQKDAEFSAIWKRLSNAC